MSHGPNLLWISFTNRVINPISSKIGSLKRIEYGSNSADFLHLDQELCMLDQNFSLCVTADCWVVYCVDVSLQLHLSLVHFSAWVSHFSTSVLISYILHIYILHTVKSLIRGCQ